MILWRQGVAGVTRRLIPAVHADVDAGVLCRHARLPALIKLAAFGSLHFRSVLVDPRIDNDDEEEDEEPPVEPSGQENPGTPPARRTVPKVGMKEDVFTLDEGDVVFQWPERLSKESFQDLESWMEIQLRKIKRRIVEEDPAGGSS